MAGSRRQNEQVANYCRKVANDEKVSMWNSDHGCPVFSCATFNPNKFGSREPMSYALPPLDIMLKFVVPIIVRVVFIERHDACHITFPGHSYW